MDDLLRYAIDEALKLGADYAEARYQKDLEEVILLKNGVPEISARSIDEGIGVRVLIDGGLGFASTSELKRSSIRSIVRSAVSAARASTKLLKNRIKLAEGRLAQAKVEVKPRIRFDAVDLDAKIEFLKDIDGSVVEAGTRKGVKAASRFFELKRWDMEKHLLTSDGADVYLKIPRVMFEYFITLSSPGAGSIQRFEHLGESRGWEAVESWRLVERIPEEVSSISRVLLEGVSPPKDPVDLILGPELVGIICHESAGHPSEADRVLGREAAQGGESYIRPELLGARIGSEKVTIVDDPTIPGSFGYQPYDDEGVEGRERRLIDSGVIKELLHNRETAAIFGVESNGAARAAGYDYEPIIRMSNTYMKPGDYSFQELVEDIREGVYVKSYQEWNIDDQRWNQRYVGVEAYRIVDGELREPVRNPVIELTTKSLYSAIDAVGKDIEFFAGYCGKGDPMQGIPVWFGGPHIRVRGVRLGVRPAE
ncbi:MAG: TldD/PmbA family protein [Thaumarchaeota archaeon]|nr:MAG: TldD/PmbA family protein [Nitrososphaerota archaeon]